MSSVVVSASTRIRRRGMAAALSQPVRWSASVAVDLPTPPKRRVSHPDRGEAPVTSLRVGARPGTPGGVSHQRPFSRLAIVNRGEAAMRAIHAVRELNEERDEPIRVIALYTETERHALFVRQADERHCLGPAMVDGKSAYLDYERLEHALTETRADAAWVGWGFVAEHPAFAELCDRLGIVFAGPEADTMRALGDKIEGKKLAEQAGVPVAAWSGGPGETAEGAQRYGEELGLPLMIKAAARGGGGGGSPPRMPGAPGGSSASR